MHRVLSPWFSDRELACRHCGAIRFHPGFPEQLAALRIELALPMHVLSACRCKVYNDLPVDLGGVGGHVRSLHVCDYAQHPGQEGTLGIDVATLDGNYRGRLFSVAWRRGWSIGWNAARRFLHIDRRDYAGLAQTSFDY